MMKLHIDGVTIPRRMLIILLPTGFLILQAWLVYQEPDQEMEIGDTIIRRLLAVVEQLTVPFNIAVILLMIILITRASRWRA